MIRIPLLRNNTKTHMAVICIAANIFKILKMTRRSLPECSLMWWRIFVTVAIKQCNPSSLIPMANRKTKDPACTVAVKQPLSLNTRVPGSPGGVERVVFQIKTNTIPTEMKLHIIQIIVDIHAMLCRVPGRRYKGNEPIQAAIYRRQRSSM